MLVELYEHKKVIPSVVISPNVRLLSNDSTVVNGQFSKGNVFVDSNVADQFKQFNVYDFNIAQISATGAVQLLKPVTMRNSDVESFSQRVDAISAGIDAAVESKTE